MGVMGAAAAVAKLNRFDLPQVLTTLGIAASEGAGLRENFGTMTKPFHAGKASENGVVAADFAALGWTATHEVLEAPRGFFQAAGGGYDPSAILSKLVISMSETMSCFPQKSSISCVSGMPPIADPVTCFRPDDSADAPT